MSTVEPQTPLSSPAPQPATPGQAAYEALAATLDKLADEHEDNSGKYDQVKQSFHRGVAAALRNSAGRIRHELAPAWDRLAAALTALEDADAEAATWKRERDEARQALRIITADRDLLRGERDRARAENASLREQLAKEDGDFDARIAIVDELIAERDRYRQALEYILRTSTSVGSRQDARRALAGEPQPWAAAPGDGSHDQG